MKRLIILFFLFSSLYTFSQEQPLLTQSGISLTYKVTKLREDKKKDVYLLQTTATNTNSFDCYYLGPSNGVNPFLAEFNVRNSDFGSINLTASLSRLSTADGKLYLIKKGDIITSEKEIKVPTGATPLVTGKLWVSPKDITDFR